MIAIIIFIILHWYASLFIQSFFHHRYAAHQQFTMSTFWERFFYIFAWVVQGSCYLSPKTYALLHRQHHAYADKEGDPHSPKHFSNFISLTLGTSKAYKDILHERVEVDPKFTKNVPDWEAFDKIGNHWLSRVMWAAFYLAFYLYFAPSNWFLLLVPFHVLQAALHGTIINWGAHKYGYKNFEMENTSTNLWPWDLLMMGEGLHNNHHKYPASPNFGQKWFEFDPTWFVMRLLRMGGIIQLAKK